MTRKTKTPGPLPEHMTPEGMRKREMERHKTLTAWAAAHAYATKPPTFPERRRGAKPR